MSETIVVPEKSEFLKRVESFANELKKDFNKEGAAFIIMALEDEVSVGGVIGARKNLTKLVALHIDEEPLASIVKTVIMMKSLHGVIERVVQYTEEK